MLDLGGCPAKHGTWALTCGTWFVKNGVNEDQKYRIQDKFRALTKKKVETTIEIIYKSKEKHRHKHSTM